MEKTRNYHMDNMKALLIFLVILGHMITRFGDSRAADILYNIIFSFHMPAFLFISGYFAKYNPKKLLANLLPLYLIFQVLQYIETYVIRELTGIPMMAEKFDLFTPEWTLWYLVVLMIYQLVIPVFDTESYWRQIGFLILAMFLGLAIGMTPDTNNFLAISRAFVFLPFFLAGFYAAKDGLLKGDCPSKLRKKPKDSVSKEHRSGSSFSGMDLGEMGATPCNPPCTLPLSAGNSTRQEPPEKEKAKPIRLSILIPKLLFLAAGVLIIAVFARYDMLIDSANFKGTESYEDVGSIFIRLLVWLVAFLWILILLLWVPKRNLGFFSRIGRHTLAVYLLHGPILLLLDAIGLERLFRGNLAAMIVLSFFLSWALAREKFDRLLHGIRIPTSADRTTP